MSYPTIDHRGPEFGALGLQVLAGIKKIFKTEQPVVIYPASGTGSWEAALSNTMNPGDTVLMYETGHFATCGMFRIGHLGEANDLTLMATLAGCEMGLKLAQSAYLFEEFLVEEKQASDSRWRGYGCIACGAGLGLVFIGKKLS